jgi:hypothetical protein
MTLSSYPYLVGIIPRKPRRGTVSAKLLAIDGRTKSVGLAVARPTDFTCHEVAPIDPTSERLVMVQSTGRCGSTLVSHAFAAADDAMSFSEPDVYYQLHQLRDQEDAEFEPLLKTCTTLLCAPWPASTWVIKFRSLNIELAGPLLHAFPGTTTVFLYRQAESWARSFARASGAFTPEALASWGDAGDVLPRVRSLVDGQELARSRHLSRD